MKAGNKGFHWSVQIVVALLVFVIGTPVLAQTPPSTCANDSLFLLSPDALVFERQIDGRNGLLISWQDISLDEATCFVLTGHEDLEYGVSVDGGFGDQVDRQLLFSVTETSVVGSTDPATLLMSWITEGSSIYGVLSGFINLANNGGVYRYAESSGQWEQANDALPMTWRQTNTVAMDAGTGGFIVAAFSSGQTMSSNPEGLYVKNTLGWQRIAEDLFTNSMTITHISVSPNNNDHFAVGTDDDGLYVTTDGGESFVNWGISLDPDFDPEPSRVRVSALAWSTGRIWTFIPNLGLFYSQDNGISFQRSDLEVDVNLDEPELGVAMPVNANDITVNPADDDHVLISLQFNGVFQTIDGGLNWTDTYGDLMVANPADEGAWSFTASSVLVDPVDSNILVVGMKNKGMYRTTNGGLNWVGIGANVNPPNVSSIFNYTFLASDDLSGKYYCLMDEWSIVVSSDQGATWDHVPNQPMLNRGISLALEGDGSGNFYMASWGGGIFVPGSTVALSDTYNTGTTPSLRELDLGLDITIEAGQIYAGSQFTLKCQTFQGWAVWRGAGHTPDELTLIGVFDRVNPESCIEGYCGNVNWQVIPQCYNSKRAACFNFDTSDTVRFFDEEIYNGFTYNYSVTSFDYGNTALTSPQNSSVTANYSPRWAGDTLSPFEGQGNRKRIQLDIAPTGDSYGDEIYVFPNPLRLDSGLPGEEGGRVVFTNLPEGARVRVFTTAGDDIINLGPDNLNGGNIYWRTKNRDAEDVAAGVYLYKVEMPSREDYWGKLVIIR